MPPKKQEVNVYIDVEFCGKTYANANYVQGSTVEASYLRWVPAFGVSKHPNRKASIHMSLQLADGSTLDANADEKFPSSAERVVLWSSGCWGMGCVICKKLAFRDESCGAPNIELTSFHRVELPALDDAAADISVPVEWKEEAEEETKKKGKNRKKKARADAAKGSNEIANEGEAGLAIGSAAADQDELHLGNDVAVDAEKTCVEGNVDGAGYQPSPSPPAALESEAADLQQSCQLLRDSEELDRAEVHAVESACPAFVGKSQPSSLGEPAGPCHWRVQSEHSRSIEFEDEEEPSLHTVVEHLAGVVRNLASTVRETSVNVAKLQEVVAADHDALQKHLQESQQDRKVMLQLLSVLAAKKQEPPKDAISDSDAIDIKR